MARQQSTPPLDIAAGGLGDSRAAALIAAAQEAFVDGWAAAMWVGAGAMAALFVFLVARTPKSVGSTEAHATEQSSSAPVAVEVE